MRISNFNKFYFECIDCSNQYQEKEVKYICPDCSTENTPGKPQKGVLKTLYDYEIIQGKSSEFTNLKKNSFLDLLPINKASSFPNLKVGNTPLYGISNINDSPLNHKLYLKDDSQNPTYSFKDRASILASAYAKEKGYNTIIAASTGNAGSSIAGICASQGQKAIIIVPETAPLAKLSQILMYGAQVIPVKGNYDEAFNLSVAATEVFGWYNRNTAFNPFTIEGKKTVSFEIYEQMQFKIPDRIFVPVGDGAIISGVYKGFEDLLNLGNIDHIPILVAVQSEGSDNLVRNIFNKEFIIKKSRTIADSISVDVPRNFLMARQFIKMYKGETITVSDEQIMDASIELSKNTGLFAEPAATASFAGYLQYDKHKKLPDGSDNVVLLTGSGLKDIPSIQPHLKIPDSIAPDIKELKKIIS